MLADDIERHVRGAIVTHRGPFANLEVPVRKDPMPAETIERWVKPLYMDFFKDSSDETIGALWDKMNRETAELLLCEFNWRHRSVGGYIVALRELHELTELVGKLLLRSDVCYAGRSYCMALAQLNTVQARRFLHDYLGYYLTRPELYFDQGEAMGAVAYLDSVNASEELGKYTEAWESFASAKSGWRLEQCCESFARRMERVRFLKGLYGAKDGSSL